MRRRQGERPFESRGQHLLVEGGDDRIVVEQPLPDVRPVSFLKLRLALAVGRPGALERELVQADAVADDIRPLQPAERRIEVRVGRHVVRVDGRL